MLIYLSEESLNSLFGVLNETSVSGSYDEKVNRLKRSGVLSDSQDFTCHQTLNKMGEAKIGNDVVAQAINRLGLLANILSLIKDTRSDVIWAKTAPIFESLLIRGEIDPNLISTLEEYASQKEAAGLIRELSIKTDEQWTNAGYMLVAEQMLKGTVPLWARIAQSALRGTYEADLQRKAFSVIKRLEYLSISLERVANEQSEKLADFFPDGSYNYTFIMFPTVVYPNGDAGKGTCQITSQYDVNTQGLVQKLLNQNYQSYVNKELHRFLLRTLDIYGNNRSINSIGSSTNGTYIINDNTCTIIKYGYSATIGEFTKFKTIIIKTGIGFISTTYIRNDDDSETLRKVTYYTKV